MTPAILVINSGSSSLKFSLYPVGSNEFLCRGTIDWAGKTGSAELRVHTVRGEESTSTVTVDSHGEAFGVALREVREATSGSAFVDVQIVGIGHRVVHGGVSFRESVLIDSGVRKVLADLATLAPLHNPQALAAMDAANAALPDVPQVAMFDTAYFAGFPPQAYLYPVPYEWFTDWGIRRFGFHGISHEYCAHQAATLLGKPIDSLRLVICHLGNGCSATAVANGQPVTTTMGFTPLDGLMMGTRAGAFDPGILLHIQQRYGVTAESLQQDLNHLSGLLGVSGISSDVRQLEASAAAGNSRARLALDMFADRVRASIGALTVTLGGLDALVFTAGVGENSSGIRQTVCQGLGCIGLHVDLDRNAHAKADTEISTPSSPARILVIETREDLMIARETGRVLRL